MGDPILHHVFSVTATAEPETFVLNIDITDMNGDRYTTDYYSSPNDPYGLNPIIRQWLIDNPDFPVEPYVPVEEQAPIRTPTTIAMAKLTISELGVEGIGVDSAFAGAFQMGTGSFFVFFATPQPDTDYIVNAFDGGLIRCYVKAEDYGTDAFTVTTTDLSDNPVDPATLSIIVIRAI